MSKVYDIITERIIERLEAGTVPWRKSWRGGHTGCPRNLKSGAAYRGINVFLLTAMGYDAPQWVTFKQALALGGSVRKGEKSTPVIFWNFREKEQSDGSLKKQGFIRYYRVFNIEQCDGLQVDIPEPAIAEVPFCPIRACEDLVAAMPCPPAIHHGGGRACYRPSTDAIHMPKPERFEDPTEYYSTLFHELTHSTGHDKRVPRKGATAAVAAGSHAYSKEELVAEMGAAFLSGLTGIEAAVIDNQAAYIQGWLAQLRGDKKLVIQAAGQAQKAVDYITCKEAFVAAA